MKRISLLLSALAVFTLSASAQTLCVRDAGSSVAWLYDANTLQQSLPFVDGALSIDGFKHKAAAGQWMSVDSTLDTLRETPDVVHIFFGRDAAPAVFAPGNLAQYLTVKVSGANASDVDITVADALERELTFVLTGSGSTFALHGNYKTTVLLDGVDLRATGNLPALWIDNGKRIEFKVSDGTVNTFSDAAANEKKSAFFVKGHAEWKGSGTVSVTGTSRHAYSSNEYTQFKPSFTGTFNVLGAGSDGIHVEQYLQVDGGTINVAGNKGDGIDVSYVFLDDGVTPAAEELNGQFIMNGGTITVSAKADDTKGLKCDDKMTIKAGRINATADGDGSRGVSAGTDLILGSENADAKAAYIYLTANGDEYTNPATGDVDKCRGLKVKRDFYHYPSTLERNAASLVTKKKIVDVDGTYKALGGTLVGITIQ